jgi:hypothetical protein
VNIYIYGSDVFKSKMHSLLDHSNVKLKIGDGEIINLYKLAELKKIIKENPHQIFLIDQEKIIEQDFVTKYLKFLLPKDGIEKKFIDQYGAGDIGLRAFDDLIIYIEKRIESAIQIRPNAEDITSIDDMFEVFEDVSASTLKNNQGN